MAQKTLGYIELEWTCKRCGTKNPGTVRSCQNCGAPMEESDSFEAPLESKLIEESELPEDAKAGPDLICPYCETRNPAGASACSQCGGDLKEAARRQSGEVVGAFQPNVKAQLPCPACGNMNPANAARCQNCGAALIKEPTAPAASAQAEAARKTSPWFGIGAAAVAVVVCLALGIGLFLSFRTTGVPAVVQGASWERRVPVLELLPVEAQGWEDSLPAEAEVEACNLRYRYTSSEPEAVATEVCGTPYTIDQGSGLGKVVQDCEYQVYESWCTYTTEEWTVVDTLTASGSGINPNWPGVQLAAGQREGEREEYYVITFSAEEDGRTYQYETTSLEEYLQFAPGSRWELQVNSFGSVTGIQP